MNDIRSNLKTLLIGVLFLHFQSKAFGQTSELDCDFDTDLCKWKDYSSSGISWKRTKTSNYNKPGSFPVGDHTQGQNGYYAYVGNSSSVDFYSKSQLRSGYFRRKNFAQACFSVWYFIQGSSIPSFSIYLMKKFIKEPNPRFFKLGYQGRGWNLAKVSLDLEYQTDYTILIEGTPASYSGVVAIDDALYKEEPCELDETTINCDFETDFICGYRTDSTQRISWNRFTGQTITIETGPPNDVTTGTIFGHFMLFEPTSPSSVSGSKAILISPSGNDPSGTGCLEFYYNANGRHVNILNVYLNQTSGKTKIFTTSGDQGRPWRIVRRDIQSRGDFQILFEAIKSNAGPRGDIGLDEIKYTENKKCPNIYECNFEQDCTWQEVTDSNVVQAEWEINVAGTSTTGLGPQKDSQGYTKGYYAFLEPSAPARTGDKAQIVSPVIDDDYCLKFAYYMNGIDAGTINVYTRLINISSTRPLQLKWTLTGSKGSNWLYAQVPLPYQGPYFTFIEGIVGKGYQSYIAIDQITITKEINCKLSPVAAQPSDESTIQCSFEKDTCGWYPDTGIEGFQFIRKQGWFKLNGTGPFVDHTLENGQGWFMAAETENRKDSERARLISASPVRKGTVKCFSFWYHMYGLSITKLKVYIRKSGGDFIQDLWVKTGNQGNRWNKASFNTRSLNYDSYLAFEVSVTNGEKGHVAIDDLDFSNSYCPSVPNSVSCDFEDSLCGYRTDSSLDYYWVAQNGTSNSMKISDHTIQTIYGQYLYAQVAPFTPSPSSKLARLTSITENSSGQKCLSFFYNMFGNDANKLEVLLSSVSSTNSLWSKKIDTKRQWVKQLIDVNPLNKHQILFEATAEGSIALDDIDYKDGSCPSYGDCNFENDDLCLWESDTTVANLQWVVNTGETPTFGTGPTIDHTFGTSKGKYIYVKSIGAMSQEFARIKSYSFDPLTQPFCFEFWYHMVGRDILSLNIYQYFEESNQEKLIWKLSGQQSTQWSRGQIPLVSSERFSIIVEGYADQDPQSDIALDDLAFFNTQCQYSPINAIPSIITTNPLPTTTRTFKPISSSSTSFDCDFESGFCGWKNDDSAQILWENRKASSSASQWQPDTDFTTASSQGSYIIVDSGLPNQNGQKARISSPTLSQPSDSVYCLHFALFMYGDDVGTFNTYLNITDVGMALYFDRIGSQGNKWKMNDLELSYNFNIDFNIVFEAIVGNGARGSFAIDDVRIEEGACKKSICDFEDENICQFENDPSSSFKWLRKSGLGDTSGIAPSLDHTLGTALGHYMSIDFTSGVLSGSKARLLTPLMEGAKKCLQFYYHMRGNEKCTLDIITIKESGSVSQPFWSRFKNNGNIWNVAEVSIKTTDRYKIGFQGTVGDNWIGDIALDDVKIEDRECAPSGFCDFESQDTLCTWSNVKGEDEFDWEEGNGKTSSSGTGPSIDHTFGTTKGTYLFIETSSPRVENDRAILSSMIFDPTPARCLRFWYHMNGNSIGSLQVDILYDNGLRIPIWKLSQDQGDQWFEGTVGFSSNTTYRIYIMGIRGKSYFGDIAIDDISFVDSACGVQPSEVVSELNSLTTSMPVSTRPPASQQISCTFDNNNICGWIDDLSVKLKWTLKKGSTTSSETGPSTDVSGNGYYIYLETSNVKKGDSARIISQIVNSTYSKTTNCLTFYYHLYGETIGELNVKLQTVFGVQSESLWSRNEQHGNAWLKAHLNILPLENNLQYQILMEAIAGDSYTGDVAIDEIEFLPNRKCPPISELGNTVTFSCDFEDDLCGFVPENTTNKNRWQRAKPLSGLFSDNPNVDNTLQTKQGYYLQSPPVFANNLTSRITTVQFDPQSDGRCLNFYMYSNSAATPLLKIYLKIPNQPEKLIFAPSPSQSPNWVQFELEVPVVPVVPYNLILESVSRYVFAIGYANLGVDDFALKTGPCRKHPGDCTFELEGLCGWSNLKDDVFDWLLHQGPTVSSSTGPSIDHTLNSDKGTFVYIETSSPRKQNDIARLASETWSPTNSLCFTFWYNAYGKTIGSLKVYIADSNSTLQNLIWEISGQQSNDSTDWKQGVVPVSYDQDFKLIFEGIVGTSITGDIAVDDIVIIENATSCIRQPSFSEPTTPGPSTSTPGPVNGFDCDFETNFCGWKRESDSFTDWIRKTGETYGGPKVDHTYGTKDKYYIYFESDDYYDYYSWTGWGSGPSRSKIVSPKIFGDAKQCLKFWYYMKGANNGELNVYYRVEKQPGSFVQSAVIWRINTGHGDHWNLAHVQFDGNNQSISNFVIEAYAGYFVSGQIAIDDISLIYGDCENQTYSSVDCDFEEEHICGYQPDPFADFNWSRNKGTTLSSNTGPSVDVSTGTKFGYYMYIETSSYTDGKKARLTTPTQDFKEGKCLYFWYHAFGKDVGSLNVYNELQTNSSNKPRSLIWSISRDQGDRWFLARVPTNVQTNFKIIFEGVVGKSYLGDVAIDDVKMSKEQCPVTFECDFEDDEFEFCSWINLQNSPDENLKNGTLDNFDWVIDTVNDYRGKLAVSKGLKINHYSRLVSEYVPGTSDSGVCIEFYYRFSKYPPTGTKLTFSLAEYKKEPVTLWSLTDNQITTQGVYWRFGRFAVKTNESFRIYMDGYVGTDSKEYVAADSIDMRTGTVGCTVFPLEAQTQVLTTTVATTTTVTYPSIAEFDCSFEKACSWSNDPANLFTNWTAKRAIDISDSNSPQNDHTYGTTFGTYLTLEKRNYFPQAKINFISPEMNGTKCVEFWYYMYGIDVGTLSMFRKVTTSSISQSIWSTKDSSQNSWRFAQASINYILDSTKYSARIEFEFSQPGFNGFVAIDDIIVHEGFCKTTDLCTFENPDLCGYTNDPLADTNWIRANSSYSTPTTGPSSDHTLQTPEGNFMLFDASQQKNIARLESPIQVKSSGSCVHFFYNTNGKDVYGLKVYKKSANLLGIPLWTTYGNTGDQWLLAEVTLKSPDSTWQAVFEGLRGYGNDGNIAIDDIRITKGDCPNAGDCNFEEKSLCNYRNNDNSQIKWVVKQGTVSSLTGPTSDHTFGTSAGSYASFITDIPTQTGWVGRLESQPLNYLQEDVCVRFWYHMYSYLVNNLGTLNVYLYDINLNSSTLLWSLTYSQGSGWKEGAFSYKINDKHKIIFEGVKGIGRGDIALDDITFTQTSNCAFYPNYAMPNATLTTVSTTTRLTTTVSTYIWNPQSEYDCNFEKDFCLWTSDPTADFEWLRATPSISTTTYSPLEDHTYQNKSGYFIRIDPYKPSNQLCRLQSPVITDLKDRCLEFYYYAYGSDVSTLNVYLKSDQLGLPRWTRMKNQGREWHRAQLKITDQKIPYQIVFEGTVGSFTGVIAVDDIRVLSECPPSTDRFCDFESDDICGYTYLNTGNIDWKRGNKATAPPNGPVADHSLGTQFGYFMYSSGTSSNQIQRALLASQVFNPNNEQCVEFYYFHAPASIGSLNIYAKLKTVYNSSTELPIWTEPFANNGFNGWQFAQVPLGHAITNIPYQVIFEEFVSANKPGNDFNIYIDDVYVRDGSCLPIGDCDFENGFCSWEPIDSASFTSNWVVASGDPNDNFRPLNDHSTGSSYGSYAFVESANSGNLAIISSQVFQNPTSYRGRCLTFWYYISGTNPGLISIFVRNLGNYNDTLIWKEGLSDKGAQWNYGQFGFYIDSEYTIIIEGISGSSQSSVAIDDIFFKDAQYCSISPLSAAVGSGLPIPSTTTTTTKSPQSTSSPSIYDCTFELGYCNWKNDSSQPLIWKRNRGSTGSIDTGADIDHTLATPEGWYIYIETSSPAKANDSARLLSPNFSGGNSPRCLTFYYHMRGRHIGNLNVYTQTQTNESVVWSKAGTQGNKWLRGQVNLKSNENFVVIFEGVRGNGYYGDISLDDISVVDGYCVTNDLFNCDFEQDSCSFVSDLTGNFNWTRTNGRNSFGVYLDHTTNSPSGYFLELDLYQKNTGDKARVITPLFNFVPEGYCLTWYYHMSGREMGKLAVYIQVQDKRGLLWRFGEDVGKIWNAAQLSILPIGEYKNFSLIFEGEKTNEYGSVMAIDDIKIEYGSCQSFGGCTFEAEGLCFWQNILDSRDDFDWELGSYQTGTSLTGPNVDHTYSDATGTYLFIETNAPLQPGDKAWLESTLFLPTPSYGLCFDFWYHMFGTGMGTLNIYTYKANNTALIWSQSGNKGDVWLNGQVNIISASSFRLLIEGVKGPNARSDIAIDDFDFIERPCNTIPDSADPNVIITTTSMTTTLSIRPTGPNDCNFEYNLCIWTPSKESNYNWTRTQGILGDQLAGPIEADHTLSSANGWYLFANAAGKRKTDLARIETNNLFNKAQCMEFYYYFASNVGYKFNLYVKVNDQIGYPIWSRSNSNGNLWRLGRVTVKSGSSYKVLMELTSVEFAADADIFAIDDVFFTDGECQDGSDLDQLCTFSADACGYSFNASSNFKWELYLPQRNEPRAGPLPINDHTSDGVGSGYVFAKSTGFKLNNTATMASRVYPALSSSFQNESARCLEFYFFLQDTDSITLNVKAQTSTVSTTSIIWSRNYDHSNFWWKGEVNVKKLVDYSIVFEAVVGYNPSNGLVALDDIILRNRSCSHSGNICDFDDKDLCNWINVNGTDEFDWRLQNGATTSPSTGPSLDHTLSNTKGYYIYIESSSPAKEGWKANLLSEPMMINGDGCVLFWYHMYGKTIGTLNVYLISETNKDLLWTLSGEIGQSWNHGLAPFKSNVKYQIMFEGIVGSSYTGDIALDDLEIKYETCQVQPANALPQIQTSIFADCSFEDTLCFWQNEVTGTQFNWTLHSGSTGSVGTGPENGALSTQGYIYIETSYTNKNDLARLISPVISKPNVDGYCLTFYYHMFGVDINTLKFSLIRNNNFKNETTIFKKVGAQLDKWLIANVRLDRADINYDFKLAIDGIAGSGFRGDISVDEISLSIGQCPPSRICDFETDLCNWVSDTTADFNWARSSGSTNSSLTGPSFDHTTLSANGHYIYIETSYPQTTGQKARIISPTYPRSVLGDCFKFWYHLFGDSIGTLNVYSRQNNALSRALWSRSGNFGNFWRYGHVTISSQVDFQVVLEGTVGRSFTGDIAVDDIEIETGPCAPEGFCDFEDGFCGFYNTKEGDNFDWLRGKGPIYSVTGPTVDHTTQTQLGYYAYINPVPPQKFNDTAWLISEILFSPNSGCLNFFYNMNGLNIGELNVYRRVAESPMEKIWNISGNLGNKWMLGQVTIPNNVKYFDLVFEATIGNGFLGNIALDDVEFVNGGTCEYYNSTTTQKPTTTEAKPFELKCDFENSFCDWSNDPSIGAQWQRQNGQNAKFGQAPLTDVTLQSSYGYYAYIDSNYDSQLSTAVLRSPVLNKAQDTCLEFWYQLNGPINSGLTVALRNANNRTELWKRFGNVADSWSHAYVRVPSNLTVNKWIEFEGDMANIYDGYVAIDEVKLIIGDCPATQFCDFETEDICGYQQDVNADFKWSRNKVNTVSASTGPSFDHTYLTPVGHYMYIETSSPQKQGEKARLISPKVTKTPNGVCLNFWYHAYGATIGTLNVYTRKRDQLSSQPIWSISKNQGNQWRTTSVSISELEDFEVVFEGIVGSSFTGDIAIDDIFIDTRGACTKPVQCSFEESLCNWQVEPTNPFNLLRITGQQLAQLYPQTSIKVDTTLNSGYGHFLWMNPSYDMKVLNKTSRLFSQTVIASNYLNDSCFSLYYILNGQSNTGSLNIYRKIYPNQTLPYELTLTPRMQPEWQRALIPITGNGINYEIYLEITFSDQPLDLAIDDVNLYDKKCSDITDDPFNPDPSTSFFCGDGTTITYANVCDFRFDCPNRRDEQVCGDCNFENSTCQYKDVSTDTLLWNRTKARLSLNGPSVDNTLKTPDGHYIQVDLNPDAYNGYGYASIRLGRILKPCSSKCELQLYYHMFGDSDDLSIYLYENGIYTVLEEYSGDFGDRWILARVQLGRISSPFQLEFDGIRFFDYDNHDLAIDDIRLVNCEYPVPRENGCPNDYFQCKSKGCVPMIERCDLIDDCGDMSDEINCTGYHQCDFENGLCDWQIDLESDIKWKLIRGETPSFATGASRDHTTGTSLGQFVYVETSGALKGSKARLLSPIFKSSPTCEVKIFYHAFGINIGALNVYSRTGFGNEKLLFSKDREVGNYWERAFIRINSADPFQLVIEGVVGDGPFGDLCIDDISFGPGCILDSNSTFSSVSPMTTQTTSSKCPSGYFECRSNSVCLPDSKVCNFEADCDDKSDEAECGTCDFETSWCGFYDQSDDEVLWKRRQAPSQNAQGPQVDHTLISSSQKGSFLITELDPNAGVTWTRSVLLGPRFQATGAACRVSFWMFMDNSDSSALFFYTNYSNSYDYKRLGSIMGTGNKNWFNVNFNIGKMPANYQFEVIAYPEYVTDLDYYDIAIDDVEFLDCSPNGLITDEDLRCDFESGFCSYYNDVNNSIKWTRKANVSAYYQNTGPLYDHTTGVGYYAVYKPTYSNYRNDKGRLLSSIQTQSLNKDICFTFWYLMFGIEVNTLNVYLDKFSNLTSETGFDRELVWAKSGSRARRWYLGTRTVNSDKPWRVVIEALSGNGNLGEIAIDDIFANDGKCQPQRECDFDVDTCEYENNNLGDSSVDLRWILGKPVSDHSSFSNGSLVYVDLSSSLRQNSKARLVGPIFRTNRYECVQFWYILSNAFTPNALSLQVYEVQNSVANKKWSMMSTTLAEWQHGQIQIDHTAVSNYDYSVMFEGQVLSSAQLNNPLIGVDDLKILPGKCPKLLECDFEEYSICAWSQSKDDKLDWLLNQGETDSYDTGPHIDATLGTDEGVYLFLESSLPAKLDDNAILISDYVDAVDNGCFGLWYFLHGLDVYKLNIYMNNSVGSNTTLAVIVGEQGFAWQHILVNITSASQFRIYIEGIVGNGYRGDIALDDLSYSTSPCGAATSVSVSTRSTTITYPANPVDCNFDQNNTCYWTHDSQADFKWQTNKGRTQTFLTGPSADHTTDTEFGYYLYLETSPPAQANNTARLLGPYFTMSSTGGCLKFFYHMFGRDINKLNVYSQLASDVNFGKAVWQKQGNQGDKWFLGQVYLERKSSFTKTRFVIEGLVGTGALGDIAIDDVAYNDGNCPITNTCDFESVDLCGFKNDLNAAIQWNRVQGRNEDLDHSYGSEIGHYMLAKSISPHLMNRMARFLSPVYPATTLCVNFWYKTQGDIQFNIRTYSFGNYNNKPMFSAKGDRGKEWSLGRATLSYSAPYQIVFELVDQGVNDGQVWLDDINIDFRSCDPIASCTFENENLCGYTYVQGNDFNWVLLNGELGSALVNWDIPSFDHTLGTAYGSFLFLDTNGKAAGLKAQIESEILSENTGKQCLQFYLKINQNNKASLKINSKDKRTSQIKQLFTLPTDLYGDAWLAREVQLENYFNPYSLIFEGVTGSNPNNAIGQLAIDDIKLYSGQCQGPIGQFDCGNGQFVNSNLVCDFKSDCSNGQDEKNCGSCTFEESDLCGWVDKSSGSFKWTKTRNSTTGSNIGPNVDHTFNNQSGYYMAVTTNNGAFNQPASFYSPVLPFASSTCKIKFWSRIEGSSASLDASLLLNDEKKIKIFRKNTPLNTQQLVTWVQDVIHLGSVSVKFQVIFEGERSFSSFGSVVIDDVSFENCSLPFPGGTCSPNEFKCKRGNCVPMEKTCDFVDDCGDYSDEILPICSSYQKCTFDHSLCDWMVDSSISSRWKRYSGASPSSKTGPTRDHTTGTDVGSYLYLESYGNINKIARVYSRIYVPAQNQQCSFLFYSHMFGETMGTMTVYFRNYLNDFNWPVVWNMTGNQGDVWKRNLVTINTDKPFQIVIDGRVGLGSESDMAIDDTSFSPGCQPVFDQLPNKNETISTSTLSPSSTLTSQPSSQQSGSTMKPPTGQTTISTDKTSIPTCPSDFCLNGGSCFYSIDLGFGCKCVNGFSGFKCGEKLDKTSNPKDTGLIVGILIPGLIIALLMGFVIYRYQKLNNFKDIFNFKVVPISNSSNDSDSNDSIAIANPLFDMNDDQEDIIPKKKNKKKNKTYATMNNIELN